MLTIPTITVIVRGIFNLYIHYYLQNKLVPRPSNFNVRPQPVIPSPYTFHSKNMPRPIAADQRGRLLRMLIRGLMCGPTRTGMGTSHGVPRLLTLTRIEWWDRLGSDDLTPAHAYLNSNPSLNIELL